MKAIVRIRHDPTYRRDAFIGGLTRAGYSIVQSARPESRKDFLVIWNRYGQNQIDADNWEAEGGTVLVAENGYIGKDEMARKYYALAVHGHNGSGWWPIGIDDRFDMLGIEVLPWVTRNEGYALICGQRGIGSRTMASPPNWHDGAAKYMAKFGPVKVRQHPGNRPAATHLEDDLADDLAGARQCVVWSSSSGVKALVLGVPVAYDAPHWVCQDACLTMRQPVEAYDDDRVLALHKMAWAQWSVAELESGLPFVNIRDSLSEAKW